MRNIAITGRMAAGKSTLSDRLVQQHGFERASFAAHLKDIAAKVYGYGQPVQKGATYVVTDQHTGDHKEVTGREILQTLGQVVKELDQDFWVRWLLSDLDRRAEGGPYVLDDLRFPFEAKALRDAGWLIVKVEVPQQTRHERYYALYGRYPTPGEEAHPSERGVDSVNADLHVSGLDDVDDTVTDILDVAEGWCSPHLKAS